jgi:hypothetical protein
MKRALERVSGAVCADKFFVAILILFIMQALWIALSAGYPQPFDENTHFETIQLYAHHWTPFFAQPTGADHLGAVARDPSYLYHYLLSFPYRIFAHWVHNQAAQIFFLRLFSIGFFATSLVLFRKVLQKTRASNGLINVTLLFFVLVPVVPFLAGQLNYDNLLMLFAAATLLLTLQFTGKLQKGQLNIAHLLVLLAVGMLGTLVKFEFLPIFIAIILWVVYVLFRFGWRDLKKLRRALRVSAHRSLVIASTLFVVALGLFCQRYGVNLWRYGTPVPRCEQVLSLEQCDANGTWHRNHYAALHPTPASHNPLGYMVSWQVRMFLTSFYVRSGGVNPHAQYINVGPYPIIGGTASIVFVVGLILFLRYWRDIFRRYQAIVFLLFVSIFYCAVLWLHLYNDYLRMGQKFGINGRYLFPIILPVMLAVGLGFQRFLTRRPAFKPILLSVVFLLFLQGGGVLTFIVASNKYWYWPDNRLSAKINHVAQKVAKPLIIEHIK